MKTYEELLTYETFLERFRYLKFENGLVGEDTFGFNRWLNQVFYTTKEWRDFRKEIILRDNGCDLGIESHPFGDHEHIIIHHINSISKEDILNRNVAVLLNPSNVISTRQKTHNAIHYGDEHLLMLDEIAERRPDDQAPWRTR